jgi:2-polyprenyl-6-hydroxyphenyl methylase/3-demethylubiquinone-9 3-methyltransferase
MATNTTATDTSAKRDAAEELRFGFGANWTSFLKYISEERVQQAVESLRSSLRVRDLVGKTVLDAGSGSGLFSLAARRLGASVRSFDYDPHSVACTQELRRRYSPNDAGWTVEQGSVLDSAYLGSLGTFDIVYSWGVLHHTGDMWRALGNVVPLVAPKGMLFISIYNDQGGWSRRWTGIKRMYNELPVALRPAFALLIMGARELPYLSYCVLTGQLRTYLRHYSEYSQVSGRGMSRIHDMVDWVGGYPFQVAKPEAVFEFYRDRGFQLRNLKTCAGGIGCNEFVFQREGNLAAN